MNLNISNSFPFSKLADVASNVEVSATMRECRIIIKDAALKEAGKCSQYCQLPEVTEGFVNAFVMNPKGMEAVKDFIAGLQDKAARAVYVGTTRGYVCESDITIEMLAELALADSENTRVTKENVTAWFASVKLAIANFLSQSRDLNAIRDDEYWSAGNGAKFVAIAENYKPLFLELASRKPSYASADIKGKIEMVAAAVMSGTVLEEKMLAKLDAAVIATVDELGL